MGTDGMTADGCTLCGRSLPEAPVDDAFCCRGCADVHAALGAGDDRAADAGAPARAPAADAPDAAETTFLRVDGMHCLTCEAFLESVAESQAGVVAAEASYVTETVRVDHDPERVSPAALADALTTVGYEATPRDGTADPEWAGDTDDRRGVDDMLGFRYVAGVVFGSFMLLPYVLVLYPAHLAPYIGGPIGRVASTFGFGGGNTLAVLPLFLVLTGVVLFFTGTPLLRGAYVGLKMRRPNTDLLAAITVVSAYVYSTLALLAGRIDIYYDLTIVVAAGVVAAMFYESLTKRRAMDRLTDLTVSDVDEARLYRPDGTTATVPVEDLDPGDRVLVKRGERIPVDGVLDEGRCTVDEAVVTGESLPVAKRAGDDLVGGSVVTADAALLRVGDGATSSIDRLTTAVWDLQSAAHGIQRRADGIAARVVPVVGGAAALVAAATLALGGGAFAAVLAGLTALMVASPWALGLSMPLSVATSVEAALERGIVVFDDTVFERLRESDVVVFDKTGTLTTGEMGVLKADAPADLLAAAAALERRAAHPAADAIVTAFGAASGDETRADGGVVDGDGRAPATVRDFRSHATGVEGTVDGTDVLVGHPDLFADLGWTVGEGVEARAADAREAGRLPVVVGRDGRAEGVVVVGDEAREGWAETLSRLYDRGMRVVVLTGDDAAAAGPFARHPDVEHVFAGVPPAGKTAAIRRLRADGHVTMVGDGTNDAPALARADLGITLGSGTALASDAADLAVVGDDLGAVETAFDVAAAAGRRVRRNNRLALVYNAVTIPLAALGLLNPVFAMAAAVATGLLVAANSSRDLLAD